MKKILLLFLFLVFSVHLIAQQYDSLPRLESGSQKVYFSIGAKPRAEQIAKNVANAEAYFKKELNVQPEYTLLVLSPADWKKFAHPNAIYGMPHYLSDGRLIVASENNAFWRRNIPPLDKLPPELAEKVKQTYSNETGELSLRPFFDLLAIHELGHAFQKAAAMKKQRNWMGELLCNVLLHTYIAQHDAALLPALTLFPHMTITAIDPSRLTYTTLEDFETYYNDIAQKHPDNYGWFQCRFHAAAAQIYDAGGTAALKSFWTALLRQKETLNDTALAEMFATQTHPAIQNVLLKWNNR